MIKVSKEVSLGTLLQIVGYIIMVIFFTAQIQAGITALNSEVNSIKTQVQYLQTRMDNHIDSKK